MTHRRCTAWVLAMVLAGIVGCGGAHPDRAPISGKVMIDGRPMPKGTISFVPKEGTKSPSSGAQILGGEFSIPADKGPMHGKFAVRITSYRQTDEEVDDPMSPTGKSFVTKQIIPARFNEQTTLEATVSETGENVFTFEVSTEEAT